jgi:hypothetical protein
VTYTTYYTKSGRAFLSIDADEEAYFVQFNKGNSIEDGEEIDALLERFGLEMMDEGECPSEFLANGVKVWCALRQPALFPVMGGARWETS